VRAAAEVRTKVMGSKTDKIKGYANEAAGKIKQGVGRVIGNEQM
jgi:uncharacterized protein YjbJ (UPF0337 family)